MNHWLYTMNCRNMVRNCCWSAEVVQVIPGSWAAQRGLQEKDELVAVAGQPISSLSGAGLMRYVQSVPWTKEGSLKNQSLNGKTDINKFREVCLFLMTRLMKTQLESVGHHPIPRRGASLASTFPLDAWGSAAATCLELKKRRLSNHRNFLFFERDVSLVKQNKIAIGKLYVSLSLEEVRIWL